MNRRQFLALTGATALAGCAGLTTSVPIYVAAIQAIGKEAVSIMPQLESAATALGIAIPANAPAIVNDIISVAGGVGNAATAAQGHDALTQIETYINTLAPLAVPIITAFAPSAGAALGLIVAALPAIEGLVDIIITELTPLAQSLAQDAPAPPATAAQRLGAAANDNTPAARAKPYLDYLLQKHAA